MLQEFKKDFVSKIAQYSFQVAKHHGTGVYLNTIEHRFLL